MNVIIKRESKNKTFTIWLEEIWEEIEIQFYGIISSVFFFVLVYFVFHPHWMRPLFYVFSNINCVYYQLPILGNLMLFDFLIDYWGSKLFSLATNSINFHTRACL